MSNFTSDQFANLIATLKACDELGIKHVILEQHKLRAATDDKAAVIVMNYEEQLFGGIPDYVVAISRVKAVVDRLNLISARYPTLTLQPMDAKPYYKTLACVSKSHQFDVRFADPETLVEVVPKGIKGTEVHRVQFTVEDVKNIVDASRVFGPDNIWLHIAPSGVRLEMIDPSVGEKISIQISDKADVTEAVGYKYSTDVMIRLLNQKVPVEAVLHSNGLLRVAYKGLDVYMLRRQG